MKGFKDPQGKFRPTENKNGVRKSRDQTAKTEGVIIRKQRGSLPAQKIQVANAPPNTFLTEKEPFEKEIGKDFMRSSHRGDIFPTSMGKESGIFHTKPFKHPTNVPLTPRGFDSPTEEVDIWTDQYGNIIGGHITGTGTRTGAGTYSGGDADQAEHYDVDVVHSVEGKPIYGHSGERSTTRSPIRKARTQGYYE